MNKMNKHYEDMYNNILTKNYYTPKLEYLYNNL